MEKKLKSYFGIDFGTTSSATVGYMVMDNHIPEEFYMEMMRGGQYHQL